jgi:uncharacterized damage-inducible protein DinB
MRHTDAEHLDPEMVEITCNLDDMNPEWYEHVMNRLFETGAHDVWLVPIIMKRGRPGVTLHVLINVKRLHDVQRILFTETTTLGLRWHPVTVQRLGRTFHPVETPWGTVRVKVATHDGEIVQFAPEYRDCHTIAETNGVPLKHVMKAAEMAWIASLPSEEKRKWTGEYQTAKKNDAMGGLRMSMDLRYPVGRFEKPEIITMAHVQQWIEELAGSAEKLRNAVAGLTPQQWDTSYRPGGWTVRQVVHHVTDAQIHNYIRFKRALTEEEPEVYVWEHDGWAEMADSLKEPPEVSLQLFEALNRRWVALLRSMDAADFKRAFRHPVMGRMSLDEALGFFVWHDQHHAAHITHLRQRMGW